MSVCFSLLAESLSVREIWQTLGISHRLLDLSFRNSLRCSPREYISRARIKHAKKLLAAGDKLKLRNIARSCGFNSLRQFYTVFRRIAGTTPGEYRRRVREKY